MTQQKLCYIIGPIGESDSKERKWSNFVREHIIQPAVTSCGYAAPARADDPDKELIMTDIIQQMFEADLVVADLTYLNPNVFYELGIRHCSQKPAIHLIETTQSPPFDLGGNKAIFIGRDHEKVISAKSEIEKRIKAIEKHPDQFFSQVQQHIQYKQLELFKKTQTGKDKMLFEALTTLIHATSLQTEIIRELEKKLVEKPKQLPSRFREAYHKERFLRFMEEREKPKAPDLSDITTEKRSEKDEPKQ